jgi:hypothetical protein
MEHNRVAADLRLGLRQAGVLDRMGREALDELLYQEAKRVVIAEVSKENV